jgi:hypothetical protein
VNLGLRKKKSEEGRFLSEAIFQQPAKKSSATGV